VTKNNTHFYKGVVQCTWNIPTFLRPCLRFSIQGDTLIFVSKIVETTSASINCGSFPFCKMLRPTKMKSNNKIIKIRNFVMKTIAFSD
jgi:hypothetical protein